MPTYDPEESRVRHRPGFGRMRTGPPITPVNREYLESNPEWYFQPEVLDDDTKLLRWVNNDDEVKRKGIFFPHSNASTYTALDYFNDTGADVKLTDLDAIQDKLVWSEPLFEFDDGLKGKMQAGQILADAFLNTKIFQLNVEVDGDTAEMEFPAGDWTTQHFPADEPPNDPVSVYERSETHRDWLSSYASLTYAGGNASVQIGWENNSGHSICSSAYNPHHDGDRSGMITPVIRISMFKFDGDGSLLLRIRPDHPSDDDHSFVDEEEDWDTGVDSNVLFLGRELITSRTNTQGFDYSFELTQKETWDSGKWL